MSKYVGCDRARGLLEGLIDGELSMADQLAVESHLRWCRECAFRVEDMRLIGASLRDRSSSSHRDRHAQQAVAAIHEAVLMRVRAERDQSLRVRLREMFVDMRLLWPALGATAAVAVCVSVAFSVLQASAAQSPESLSALIADLSNPTPLRPADNGIFGISIPRPNEDDAERTSGTLDALPDDDVIYTIRTVVSRDGRVSNYEVLLFGGDGRARTAEHAGQERAVLDAVAQTRFAAAHTALGKPVAVDMVWVIAKTTAVAAAPVEVQLAAPVLQHPVVKDEPKPAVQEPATTDDRQRSSTGRAVPRLRRSATV
jgi:hypothetical protein